MNTIVKANAVKIRPLRLLGGESILKNFIQRRLHIVSTNTETTIAVSISAPGGYFCRRILEPLLIPVAALPFVAL